MYKNSFKHSKVFMDGNVVRYKKQEILTSPGT